VGRRDLEGVRAVRDAAVALRAGAGGEGRTVERTLEAGADLGAEAEARGGAVARVGRRSGDARARRDRVDRPRVARHRAGVAGGVARLHLERMAAVRDTAVALRARAGRERRPGQRT